MTKPSWLFDSAASAAVDSPLFNLNQRGIELYTGSRRCCCKFFYYHHQLLGFLGLIIQSRLVVCLGIFSCVQKSLTLQIRLLFVNNV